MDSRCSAQHAPPGSTTRRAWPCSSHQFRHSFATAVLDASGGNLLIARDAGGWASATTVDAVLRARRHPRSRLRGRPGEGLGRAVTAGLALLPSNDRGRQPRDRLEVLTALIHGPGFAPLFRSDIIQIPLNHPVFRWNCMVHGCERPTGVSATRAGIDLCFQHQRTWKELSARGCDRLEFLRIATPWTSSIGIAPKPCRVSGCGRPARRYPARLCVRHVNRWRSQHGGSMQVDNSVFGAWAAGEQPYESYGVCRGACCDDLAKSPLGLCEDHEARYGKDGRPGQATLPGNWVQSCMPGARTGGARPLRRRTGFQALVLAGPATAARRPDQSQGHAPAGEGGAPVGAVRRHSTRNTRDGRCGRSSRWQQHAGP